MFALISCGGMPSITMNDAIKLASEIKARQDDSSLFTLPENFTIEYSVSGNVEEKTENGLYKSNGSSKTINELDIENLRYREYYKTTSSSGENETEMIVFYDKGSGILYTAKNQNGYKTRLEQSKTQKEALNYLKSYQTTFATQIKWRGSGETLDTYETNARYYEEQHQKYINENDQYVNPSYGSSGAKDLQTTIDSKLKCIKYPRYGSDLTYEGYSNNYISVTLKNDMTETSKKKNSYECYAKENNNFYIKDNSEANISYRYGGTSIKLPNIEEYIKVK